MLRTLKFTIGLGLAALLVAVLLAGYWLQRPLAPGLAAGAVLDVSIPAGATARRVAEAVADDTGVATPAWALHLWFRLSGQARQIQAGSYEITASTTPLSLLDQLVRGEQAVRRLTLVEGWNWPQVLQALRQAEHLRFDLDLQASPQAVAQFLGLSARHPEGRFFPDTYIYPKHSRASDLLKQAAVAMDRHLAEAWAQRDPGLPLRTVDEALVLASLVEKETGLPTDRPQVAGVFVNRLRIGMRLQTDPSVIYGLGPAYAGRLRRADLERDTPYNTYTRAGLPPTPIAMPGLASLRATTQPAATPALYFVARGDGSSQFSRTLDEHNAAVRRYILNR